jgi:hypothetical protein
MCRIIHGSSGRARRNKISHAMGMRLVMDALLAFPEQKAHDSHATVAQTRRTCACAIARAINPRPSIMLPHLYTTQTGFFHLRLLALCAVPFFLLLAAI